MPFDYILLFIIHSHNNKTMAFNEKALIFCELGSGPQNGLLETLSPSCRQIAELVIAGWSNTEIAALRGTSPRTVANQLACLFATLEVTSRAQLARRVALGR